MKSKVHINGRSWIVLLAGISSFISIIVSSVRKITKVSEGNSGLSQAERLAFISEIERRSEFVVIDSMNDLFRYTVNNGTPKRVDRIEFFSKKTNFEIPTTGREESATLSWAHLSIKDDNSQECQEFGFYFFRDKGGVIHVGRIPY